MEKISEIIET